MITEFGRSQKLCDSCVTVSVLNCAQKGTKNNKKIQEENKNE